GLLQRFIRALALADIAQDCLEVPSADRCHRNFYRNDVSVFAYEIPLVTQGPSVFQLLEPLSKKVTLFRKIGVRDGRPNQFRLRNSSEFCAGAVSQNTDAVSINDINRVGGNIY